MTARDARARAETRQMPAVRPGSPLTPMRAHLAAMQRAAAAMAGWRIQETTRPDRIVALVSGGPVEDGGDGTPLVYHVTGIDRVVAVGMLAMRDAFAGGEGTVRGG